MMFEPLPDGSVRRTVLRVDGTVEKQEVLVGPQRQLMATRAQSGLPQSGFARAKAPRRAGRIWPMGRSAPRLSPGLRPPS